MAVSVTPKHHATAKIQIAPASALTDRGMTDWIGVDVDKRTCSIVGCEKPVRATGWCKMHYNTWYRTGDVLSPPAYTPTTQCEVDGCDSKPRSSCALMCEVHYYRMRRNDSLEAHGNDAGELNHLWTGDAVGYRALHSRIKRSKGSAAEYQCVDCGKQAKHWSYDHLSDSEKQAPQGVYSTDLDRYEPRCVACHMTFDLHYSSTTTR